MLLNWHKNLVRIEYALHGRNISGYKNRPFTGARGLFCSTNEYCAVSPAQLPDGYMISKWNLLSLYAPGSISAR